MANKVGLREVAGPAGTPGTQAPPGPVGKTIRVSSRAFLDFLDRNPEAMSEEGAGPRSVQIPSARKGKGRCKNGDSLSPEEDILAALPGRAQMEERGPRTAPLPGDQGQRGAIDLTCPLGKGPLETLAQIAAALAGSSIRQSGIDLQELVLNEGQDAPATLTSILNSIKEMLQATGALPIELEGEGALVTPESPILPPGGNSLSRRN